MGTTDWARRYRRLSAKSSAKEGRYNPELTPWVYGMHAALDDPKIQKVICMKSAQVAWTDGVLMNYIGKRIHTDPCPMIVLFPKLKTAQSFFKEKLKPAIEATPVLNEIIPVTKARDTDNLWNHKAFPRGFLKLVTSNAPDDVKSTSAPVVMVEEPDDTNENVKEQGDSITLLEERTKSYSDRRRKVILGGTPTVDGFSRIQQAYEASDTRVYLVQCPDCDERHELAFENVRWSSEATAEHQVFGRAQPETAHYVCPHCGSIWNDAKKFRAVLQTSKLENYGWVKTAHAPGTAGFRVGELVSPFPGSRMEVLVRKFLVAQHALKQGDDTKMRSFVNNTEGRPYRIRSGLPELDELAMRALDYEPFTVPDGGLLLTIGIDVQHNRLAIIIRAWGRGEESWLVCWGEVFGNVLDQGNDPLSHGVWGALTTILMSGYRHETGGVLRVRAASIDSSDGNTSDAVYKYVRAARARGIPIMAIKGARDAGVEIFAAPRQSVDVNQENSKAARYGLRSYPVGTVRAKDLILGNRMQLEGDGPGRVHWYRAVRDDYLAQLTAEVKVPGRRGGRPVWQVKVGCRNEALDGEVYALHAARSLKIHLFTEAHWLVEQARFQQSGLFETVPVITALPSGETAPPLDDFPDGVRSESAVTAPAVLPQPVLQPARRPVGPRPIARSRYLSGRR
ncbi:phage terminase large subunit family protein [Paraburkholderia sp. SARCC-3016]|uniref:phage terminase large subunit family protein n=1 Tax=Paraburkholderia sp. SARCC-3016 TaxID=3058611 RepID=UPI0035BE10B4